MTAPHGKNLRDGARARPGTPMHHLVLATALVTLAATGIETARSAKAAEPPTINLQLPPGASQLRATFDVRQAGLHRISVDGLRAGGAAIAEVDGKPVHGELTAHDEQGPASKICLDLPLTAGQHVLVVREEPGLQFYRVEGTQRYLATGTEYQKRPVFRLDLAERDKMYPVEVRFGPKFEPLFWFSGKWDRYDTPSYTQEVRNVATTSAAETASLAFQYVHPPKNLLMPTAFVLQRDARTGNVIVRVRQTLEFTGPCTFTDRDNIEFLHLVIHKQYGRDWGDGVPDYFWNREQVDVDNDTLQGSRTHFVLMDDNSRRGWSFHPSTSDPKLVVTLPSKYPFGHHTSFGHPLYAQNTVGGWFTKTGAGSIGWVMHKYQANFAKDLSPIHSHCGDGADTHVYAGWNKFFFPWQRKAGDRLEVEYTLQCLPSEPLREQVELINEYDLVFFGEERQARSKVVGWYGTKDACGLVRSDGSAVVLGIGRAASRYPIPAKVRPAVRRVYRLSDLRNCNYVLDTPAGAEAVIEPWWVTIVDCGSALEGPPQK